MDWPNGAHVALWVIPNIEFFALDERCRPGPAESGVPVPDVPTWASRDYGNRVGVFRIMDVLDRYGIRGTVALNSNLCAEHPADHRGGQRTRLGMDGPQPNQHAPPQRAPRRSEERGIIKDALRTIERATGARPRGWLGSGLQETWDTLDLLVAEGCDYVCDWTNDDQPYIMKLDGGKTLVSVPYSHEINDKPAFERFNRTAENSAR